MPRKYTDPRTVRLDTPADVVRGRSAPVKSRTGSGKTDTRGLLNGLSSRATVADMTRWAADTASREARRAALKVGKTSAQVRGAVARARADAIKSTAARAGVSTVTARRWANGTQQSSRRAEASRTKVQRSLGGAREFRAAQVAATSRVDLGTVKVLVSSGGPPHEEDRHIRCDVDALVMLKVAALIRSGDDEAAAEKFEEHVLDQYGKESGTELKGFMKILEIPESTTWI